jgi:hypothetical protein
MEFEAKVTSVENVIQAQQVEVEATSKQSMGRVTPTQMETEPADFNYVCQKNV